MEIKEEMQTIKTSNKLLLVYFEYNQLKNLYRQGWLQQTTVPKERCESVADHCFGVALLSLFISEQYFPSLDASKIIRMALLHEFGEIYGGDITPNDNVSKDRKEKVERDSVYRVLSKLKNGKKYTELWEEYENRSSKEAIFVDQIDKLEMALQAGVYAKSGNKNLRKHVESSKTRISDRVLKEFIEELEKRITL